MSKSPPICFEEKNGSLAFGAPAPLTKIFYFILFLFFLLCIIIYIYIGKIKNSIQY
jgi:preprotein translocase subunit SecG